MRKTLLPLLAIFPVGFILLAFSQMSSAPGAGDPVENYRNHCAGCHGVEYKTFVDRDWQFIQSEAELGDIINAGMPDYGMPAFNGLFTENEVVELSELLWIESQHQKATTVLEIPGLINSRHQIFSVDTLIADLDVPWGIEFLSENDLLITERSGKLLHFEHGELKAEISGLPPMFVKGQGGLMDIELHPDFNSNGWIYLSYSYPDDEAGKTGNTAIMRGRLKGSEWVDLEILFKGTPLSSSGVHFGCRLEFDRAGYLFFTIGERGNSSNAQDLTNHSGKVHRILDNGEIPSDNPFIGVPGAMKSIYSYGHRNPQGLAIHPETGIMWVNEHGPKGGDEINIVQKGKNYGWPEITYGINYNGTIITEDTTKIGMEQPFLYWTPSIAPCGMCFVTSDQYSGWKGDVFSGSLSFTYLHRTDLRGSELVGEEKLLSKIGRVRAIEESPEGILHVAVERPGMILRLLPVK